jgi:hypothetical protein
LYRDFGPWTLGLGLWGLFDAIMVSD